ncbi:MAG: nucleotidyltransferase family protein [Vicinamibacterales bacterium]
MTARQRARNDMMQRLSREHHVVLACAARQLTPSATAQVADYCRSAEFDWDTLTASALAHRITPLVLAHVTAIAGADVPPPVRDAWTHFDASYRREQTARARLLAQLIAFFADRDIRVMPVKGAALDITLYDGCSYTESGDIDLLVDRTWAQFSEANRLALKQFAGVSGLEIGFARHHDLDMNRVLDVDYDGLWMRSSIVTLGAGRAHVMSPEDTLLTMCTNLCRKRYRLLKDMMAIETSSSRRRHSTGAGS